MHRIASRGDRGQPVRYSPPGGNNRPTWRFGERCLFILYDRGALGRVGGPLGELMRLPQGEGHNLCDTK